MSPRREDERSEGQDCSLQKAESLMGGEEVEMELKVEVVVEVEVVEVGEVVEANPGQ